MPLTLYQVDAFTDQLFAGNPAAICPLEAWLPDSTMQAIASENNLAETAFFVAQDNGTDFDLRWFTPTREIDLCGHATLASAFVLFEHLNFPHEMIRFHSKSGLLTVERQQDWLELDFPAQPCQPCEIPEAIRTAFSIEPIACLKSEDYLVIFEHEAHVIEAEVDVLKLRGIDARGVIITAPSERFDFVNRFFVPNFGIDEDPVTGSAFTKLVPYWADVLNKNTFVAKQVSQRGGIVRCALRGDRIKIAGQAVLYMRGTILI